MADTSPGDPQTPFGPQRPEYDDPGLAVGEPEASGELPDDHAAASSADEPDDHPTPLPGEDSQRDLVWRIPEQAGAGGEAARKYPEAILYEGPDAGGTAEPSRPRADAAQGPSTRRAGAWRMAALALASGFAGAALAAAAVWWMVGGDDPSAVTIVERVETRIIGAADTAGTATAVARRVLPSIVTVEVATVTGGDFVADGSGSGVVLSADGLLVTNEHVVEGASEVRVVFADGRIYPAEVVGQDPLSDLALLRIAAAGLVPVEIGSADTMAIGDAAIAVGSPLGLGGGPSVTVGVISAFDRRVQTGLDDELFGMLQTDAPITRGSSGGALVDAEGRLIGITTAIGVSDVGAEGLGFAIPIEMVERITEDLLDDGVVSHAFLGVQGTTYFEEAPDGATVPAGVAIASIVPGTAAELAGLEPGDLIRSVDGVRVTTMEQLVVRIRLYRVGETVELITDRGEETLTISMTLMERPEGV